MTKGRGHRAEELFREALACEVGRQEEFLDEACAGDSSLRAEVARLLDSHGREGDDPPGELARRHAQPGLATTERYDADPQGAARNPPPPDSLREAGLLLRPGSVLAGRYLIRGELGRGGVGAVYLADDTELLGKPVVVKVLLETSRESRRAVRKFRHEMEALTRLNHPNVVNILGAGATPEDVQFIVMEYVEGESLRSALRGDGMDFERAAHILRQVGRAVSAAHAKGVLHRDLKPENVMLRRDDSEDTVKVIDFGVAKIRDSVVASSSSENVPVGTVLYMSPEQLRAEDLTTASDVYALGVIAYEMLTGRRPFNPESSYQLLEMQRGGVRVRPCDLRPSLNADAQAVVLKALEFDPSKRYQRADDFGEALARALSLQARGEVGRRARPNLRLVAGSLVALLSLAILFVVLVRRLPRGEDGRAGENVKAPAPAPARALTYWIEVQKYRGGRYDDPSVAVGGVSLLSGDRVRLHVISPQPCRLYVFNESLAEAGGDPKWFMLFPTPTDNSGSSLLAAGQRTLIPEKWFRVGGAAGEERLWLVWSEQSVEELEAIKGVINQKTLGRIDDPRQVKTVRDFISKNPARASADPSDERRQTLTGPPAPLSHLITLEHR
ncbi:MAG TPA: protein kinase [Pyrinomonadaceae bacterium]|jgi:predicted Ser/Thr protein kinase